MVEHVVLFKLNEGTTDEQRAAAMAGLKALRQQVPGIVDLSVGLNFSDRNQGFELGLVVRFVDRAALEGYLPHPAHRSCVETHLRPIMSSVIVVDYEI
jgi:hypothetical protein